MPQNSEKFRYFSAFNDKVNLQSIIFSNNSPLLEKELNELQEIQNKNRQNLARTLIPSGFIELVDKSFSAPPVIYQPIDNLNNYILNSIAIAPCKVILNGININLVGNFTTQQSGNYLLLNLGEAPETGVREDLVYLEMWLERVSYKDAFKLEGYINGNNVDYNILDSRVQDETSRRIVVHYTINVAKNVNFQKFPDGFGYNSINDFSDIQATANGKFSTYRNINLIYKPANFLAFKDQYFYKDYNLYIAGMPDYDLNNDLIIGKFIYALPMFRIKRYNKQSYSLQNFNGARTVIYQYMDTPSSLNGDLLNNIRPDHHYYDIINENNVIDLRKTVLNNNLNTYYLNQSLKELFTGKLQTKDKTQIRRVQFGRQYVDYSENYNVLLHIEFNNNIEPSELEDYTSTVSMESNEILYEPIYRDAIIAQGLYIDGRAEYKYTIDQCNINKGTLDFYIQFLYNGHTNIIQTLFKIIDVNGNTIFKCIKEKDQLMLKINKGLVNNEENNTNEIMDLVIDLKNILIFAKQINIFRFAWDNNSAKNYIIFYINGVFIARIPYIGSTLLPHALIIGDKTDAVNNANLIITDEEIANEQVFYEENSQEIDLSELSDAQIIQLNNQLLLNESIVFANVNGNQFNINSNSFDINTSTDTENNTDTNTSTDTENNTDTNTSTNTENEVYTNDDNNDANENEIQIFVNDLNDDDINSLLNDEKKRILLLNRLRNKRKNDKKLYLQQINKKRNNNNYGFIIEELILYDTTYEQNITRDNTSYFINDYWPGLPNDFINGQAQILPSFNSLYRGFSDINLKHNNIIQIINGEDGIFNLEIPYNTKIKEEPKIYKTTGEVDINGNILTLPGIWTKYENEWIFQAEDITLNSAVVQYIIETPSGNGNNDLPNKILAAGYVTDTTIYEECSFSRKDYTNFRSIDYFHPITLEESTDQLYDYYTNRTTHQSFARILYYHQIGNGTNEYVIPNNLYGYPVLYVLYVANKQVQHIQKINDTEEKAGQLIVYLQQSVTFGENIEFVLALGGTTFDYNTHTKTLVSNILRTQIISFNTDGIHNQYLLPIYTQNGGVLQSVCSIIDIDNDGNEIFKYACYVNGEMYPFRSIKNDDNSIDTSTGTYQLAQLSINNTSWQTPFMKIAFNYIPEENAIIEIPILVSYQPTQYDILSLWYEYTPYQGILNNNTKKLKRLTDWKYFITTLASGSNILSPSQDNIYSLNNLVNRLPGGNTFASYLTGEKIIFNTDIPTGQSQNLYNNYIATNQELNKNIDTIEELNIILNNNTTVEINIVDKIKKYLKPDGVYELRFLNEALFSSINNQFDDYFFELDTSFEINKQTIGYQDDFINYTFNQFKVYLPDLLVGISKYTGMACLVSDELGQILLLIIGSINNNQLDQNYKTTHNIIEPIYGDLFKISGLPTI